MLEPRGILGCASIRAGSKSSHYMKENHGVRRTFGNTLNLLPAWRADEAAFGGAEQEHYVVSARFSGSKTAGDD